MSTLSLQSPCMSDRTLLLSVEDLISLAMGPKDRNTVDFKMIQTILHILARQMRLLEQKVVLVSGDVPGLKAPASGSRRARSRGRLKSKSLSVAGVREKRRPPVFNTEEERIEWEREERERDEEEEDYSGGRKSSKTDPRRRRRSRDARGGGRGWDDDATPGGQDTSTSGPAGFDTSTSGDRRARAEKEEGRGGRGRSGGGRGSWDDDGRGAGGRGGADRDYDERGGRDRSGGRGGMDRDDDGRGGRDRTGGGRGGMDRDDDESGGRYRSGGGRTGEDRDDDGRGGRDRTGGGRGGTDRDDDGREGRDRSGGGKTGADRDDDGRGGRDRAGGGRGGMDMDDDGRGGRDRSGGGRTGANRDDDERRGRDRAGGGRGGMDMDDDGRGGRDRSGGGRTGADRDDDERRGRDRAGGGRGGMDRDDDGREGRDRSGGGRTGADRDDDGRGGRDRAGGGRGGMDRDDDGRGGRDRAGGGRGGMDRDDDGREGRDRSGGGRTGADRDDDGRGGRDRAGGGRGGMDRDDGGREGRDRSGGGRTGVDRDDDSGRGGRERDGGGRGGRDFDEAGKGGRDGGGRRGGAGRGGKDMDEGGKGGRERDGGGRGGKDRDGGGGKDGIGIREIDGPGREKLLVVEKGPTTVGMDRDRRDSIAVVTQSQFQFLQEAVDELRAVAGPLPAPTMPDNQQLRKDLAAGASLTDTMQAMQVSARVKAAEQAIGKLGGLLTQLAASGALPSDAAGAALAGGWTQDEDGVQFQPTQSGMTYKSVAIDPSAKDTRGLGQTSKMGAAGRPSVADVASIATSASGGKHVTEPEMTTALKKLREEVTKALQGQIDRASAAAETAEKTAKVVGGKVEELLKMDSRITTMYSMVEDYSEQLNGFDAGLTTQLTSFKEQMATMRSDLQAGMAQLEAANNNAETAAVMELNERYEGLVHGLEETLLLHTSLTNMQHQLTQELKSLVESVEALREQKADRDELLDGLRDKADSWRLEGLVRQDEFERARADLEQRLDHTNEKFQRQDEVWMEAVHDLTELARTKAQVMDLLKLRDEATAQVRDIDQKISRLALILGEPKAAMLMRALAREAVCGSCLAPALMEPGGGALPPLLPAARPAPPGDGCAPGPRPPPQPDLRTHRCHRWVGGSHTLLAAARAQAGPLPVLPDVTQKYTGFGSDGRMYWMETEMQPCVECNPDGEAAPAPPTTERSDAGAGDAAVLLAGANCECP